MVRNTTSRMYAVSLSAALLLMLLPLLAAGATKEGQWEQQGGDPTPAITLYVATTGSDTSGDGSEGKPFATLQRARDALRQAKQSNNGQLPRGGAQVLVRQGTYVANGGVSFGAGSVLQLGSEDSGTAEAPIRYSAFPKETVTLSGGVAVPSSSFKPFRGNVVVADLKALGITEFGDLDTGGLGQCDNKKAEVSFNGEPMVLARWPNLMPNGTWQWAQVQGVVTNVTFSYNGTRQDAWQAEAAQGTAWLHGFWEFDWADNYVRLAQVSPSPTKQLTINPKTPFLYGVMKNARYYGVNLLCELDAPNEYYIDRQKGLLYIFPPAALNGAQVVVGLAQAVVTLSPSASKSESLGDGGWDPSLSVPAGLWWPGYSKAPLLADLAMRRSERLRGVQQQLLAARSGAGGPAFITVEGFVVAYTSSTGVVVNQGTNITLRNLTAISHSEHGFAVSGTGITITGATVFKAGCTAINLVSGDIGSLTRGDSVVENSKATQYNQWLRAYGSGVSWYGVGNTVRNVEVGNAPHVGMIGSGNDNVFDGNSFHDLCFEVSDSGAWYSGRTWAKRGNVISNNVFRNVRATEKIYLGYPEIQAIYLDDQLSGHTIKGNVVMDSDTGVQLGGGRRNVIVGNTFQRLKLGVHFDNRGMNWQNASCTPPNGQLVQELVSLHYQQPPWSTHYPELTNVTQDHPCVPVYNQVTDNVWCCVNNDQQQCRFIDSSQQSTDSWISTVARNTYKAC